ncbi:MAG: hypothetical protein WCV83_02335 [Candidatus Magasanikbacteria bacterium]|jgi:hypothetical protein
MILPHYENNPTEKNGFVILLSVLIMGSVGLAVALYLLSAGLTSSQNGSVLELSNQAKALSNACAEIGLAKIANCTSTVGTFETIIDESKCSYSIIQTGDNGRTLTSQATQNDLTRKIKIEVGQVSPIITINSWQEVAGF